MKVRIEQELLKSPFIYRFPLNEGPLVESIKRFGLLDPVVLVAGKKGPVLLDGGRRVKACMVLGLKDIEGRMAEESAEHLFFKKVVGDAASGNLNPVEKAHIVSYFQSSPLLPKVLEALSVKERNVQFLIKLSRLKDGSKKLFLEWNLTETIFKEGFWKLIKDEDRVFSLLSELPLNARHLKEILEGACTLSRKRGADPLDTLEGILERLPENVPPGLKLKLLKGVLAFLIYPQYRSYVAGVSRITEGIKRKEGITLRPPPFFEGKRWHLECNFSSPEELSEIIEALFKVRDILKSIK